MFARRRLIISMSSTHPDPRRVLTASDSIVRVALALAVVMYVALATRHLSLPGLYFDEALRTGDALSMVTGRSAAATGQWGVTVAGRRWPLMSNTYTGSVKSYLFALSFLLFGINVEALRLSAILTAAVGLIFVALLARRMLGGVPAIAATWLLATDPSLILYTRTDWGPITSGFALRTAFLYFLWRWWDNGGRMPLVAAGAIAGLGIWDKASFIWVVVAVLGVGTMAWFTSRSRPSVSLADAVVAAGAGLVTGAPFWTYNLSQHWATVQSVARPGDPVSIGGILHLAPVRTLALRAMFDGTATAWWMFGDNLPKHFGFAHTWLLPLSAIGCVVSFIGGLATRRAWMWATPLLIVFILAQIYLTPRPVWVHHWSTIYPLAQLSIGFALTLVGMTPGRLRTMRLALSAACSAVVALAILLNILFMTDYHKMMVRTGGSGVWSDAIYRAIDALEERYKDRPLQVMDWGISNQLTLLSAGQLRVRSPFWPYVKSTEPQPPLVTLMRNPANVFLLFAPEAGPGSRAREALELAARTACADLTHTEHFDNRQSMPVIVLVEYTPRPCESPH